MKMWCKGWTCTCPWPFQIWNPSTTSVLKPASAGEHRCYHVICFISILRFAATNTSRHKCPKNLKPVGCRWEIVAIVGKACMATICFLSNAMVLLDQFCNGSYHWHHYLLIYVLTSIPFSSDRAVGSSSVDSWVCSIASILARWFQKNTGNGTSPSWRIIEGDFPN